MAVADPGVVPIRDRLLAVLVAVLWGINFLAIDLSLRQFPPLFFVAVRFVVIAVPTVLFVPRPKVRLRWLLGYGLGFGTIEFAFLFIAMHIGMPAGLASLVLQSSAPFTVLLGAVFLRERLRPVQVLGIVVAVAGMGLIVWHRAEAAAALPVLLTLVGGLGWAVGNLCARQARPDNPVAFTLWMSVVPPIPMFAVSLLIEGGPADWHAVTSLNTPTGWAALAGLGYISLLATVLGTSLWSTLLGRHAASVVAPFALLVPVVGVLAAWIFLGERPALIEVLAGVVVVGGVLLGVPRTRPRKPLARTQLDDGVSAEA